MDNRFQHSTDLEDWLGSKPVARKVTRIQLHHTWKPNYADFDGGNHQRLQDSMRRYHMEERGWSDIGQHITIFPDGVVMMGRSLEKNPAGIVGANRGAICIECLGDFDEGKDTMSEAQRRAIIETVAILCKHFRIGVSNDTVIYHHWFAEKSCPGTAFFNGNSKSDAELYLYPSIEAELHGVADPLSKKNETPLVDNIKDGVDVVLSNVAVWKNKENSMSDDLSLREKVIASLIVLILPTALVFGWFYLRKQFA